MSKYKNYEKTKIKIRDAFLKLVLVTNDYDSIGIKDIIKEAKIAKSTFYYHYTDLDNYLNELYDDIIKQTNIVINDYNNNKKSAEKFSYISPIIERIKKYEPFFKCLFKSEKSLVFVDKFKSNLVVLFKNDKELKFLYEDERRKEAEVYLLANGISYLFVDYFKGKLNVTVDEISDYIFSMLSVGVSKQ